MSRFSFLFLCAAILWCVTGVAQADSDYTEYKTLRQNYEQGSPFTTEAKARFEALNERFGMDRAGTLDGSGGPDNYGYLYVDNMNGDTATYDWIELRGDNSAVWPEFDSPDDAGVIVPLNFYFPLYGRLHDEIRINSNGFIEFETTVTGWSNQCLPAPGVDGPAVFGFWDDLHMSYGGNGENTDNTIAYRDFGSYIVVQFDQIGHNGTGTPTDSYTFEIILFANGKVKLQYQEVDYVDYAQAQTIGIQANASGPSLEYTCNDTGTQVADGRAVWFYLANIGYLWGTITDDQGSPLSNVGVNLDGTDMFAHSDGSGEYFFPTTPIGQYNITATLLGYEFGTAQGVNVVEGTPAEANIILNSLNTNRVESTHAPIDVTDLDTVTATIDVGIEIDIDAVGVRIDDLEHTYVDDLALWLQSPWGERVLLSFRHGGAGENYMATQFDDLAVRTIDEGHAPFMGRYLPDEPLSPFSGHESQGTWTLIIYDHANLDEGVLNDWSIIFVGDPVDASEPMPEVTPVDFALKGNFPNPFNATTEIRYDVAKATNLTMTVYNLLGQEVRTLLDGFVEAGNHTVYWDGRNRAGADLSTGIYIIQMQADGRRFTGKSMLIR